MCVAPEPRRGYLERMEISPLACDPAPDAAEAWAQAQEAALLDAALSLVGEDRPTWGGPLFQRAARATGLSPADADLLAPNGALDLAALLWRRHDAAALAALDRRGRPAKVRERIAAAVEARIDAALADEAAVRAASLFLARAGNAPTALRLGWATSDALWRWAGDVATDENHYSKRAILAAVLASTLAVRLTRGPAAARAHLDASIGRVMAFETFKARLPAPVGLMHMAAYSLGRLRYPPASDRT